MACEPHPRIPGPAAAAKLANPPPELAAAAPNPLAKALPPNPPPNEANDDIPAAANGDGENALEAGALSCIPEAGVPAGGLKAEAVAADLPRVPNGDWLDPANAAKLDEANADEDVIGCSC